MRGSARPPIHRLYERWLRPFRERRMRRFAALLGPAPGRPLRVLDVGGTAFNWNLPGAPDARQACVVLLNQNRVPGPLRAGLAAVRARAEALPFRDRAFDAVSSNSLIEHLAPGPARERAASELRRVAPLLFVQTPARSFPIEPHLLAVGVHYLPQRWQRHLIRWTTLWGLLTKPSAQATLRQLDGTRLLGARELRELFPDCRLERERYLGLTKSYLALRGGVPPARRRSRAGLRVSIPDAARVRARALYERWLELTHWREGRHCRQLALRAGATAEHARIYLYHVRKTGGTSLVVSLLSQGGEDGAAVYRRLWQRRIGRAISGERVFVGWRRSLIEAGNYHFAFSHLPAHALALPPQTFTLSCLRDPLQRVLSHYYMLVAAAAVGGAAPALERELRWLGADFDAFLDALPREHLLNQLYMFSRSFEVEQAHECLRGIDCVLLTERLEQGVSELSRRLALPIAPRHQRRGRAFAGGARQEPSPAALERLRELLEPEYQLYARFAGAEPQKPAAPTAGGSSSDRAARLRP